MREIQNEHFYQAFITGAREVMNNRLLLNQINVFPVADSDTGNNLYSMMDSIVTYSEVKDTLKSTLDSISESAIIGARGNSGVIFAQYIQGLCALDHPLPALDLEKFILATENGVSFAYSAVETPVEGTILTSMRVFYKSLIKYNDLKISFLEVLERAYIQVEASVIQSTDQLSVLKKASVVDSGAKGFAFFLRGFINGLKGKTQKNEYVLDINPIVDVEHKYLNDPVRPEYRYCTEALLSNRRGQFESLKSDLSIYGNSIIVSRGTHFSRIHLHTNEPKSVFKMLCDSFEIKEQKVDDMLVQHWQNYHRKYKTALITDSIADIPKYILDEGQVIVIPLEILIDNQTFLDGLTIDNTMLFEMVKKNGQHPTSSLPSGQKIKKILSDIMVFYDEAVIVTVSKQMSGTFQVFTKQAEAFGDRIKVVDSKQNSVAEGLIVYEAIKLIKKGLDANQIKNQLDHLISNSKLLVSVKDLDNMIASGRLNSHLGSLIKVLKIFPIISINEHGEAYVEQMIWGLKNRKSKLFNTMMNYLKNHELKEFAVTYVDDPKDASQFIAEAEKTMGIPCAYMTPCSSIIAAGAGKGAFAIAFIRK